MAPLEGAIYAETIPFNETRDYVKRVLANAMFYQARIGSRYVALHDRLGVVTPRGAAANIEKSVEKSVDKGVESGAESAVAAPDAAPTDRPEPDR